MRSLSAFYDGDKVGGAIVGERLAMRLHLTKGSTVDAIDLLGTNADALGEISRAASYDRGLAEEATAFGKWLNSITVQAGRETVDLVVT